MRHLLNPLDFTVEEIDELLELATDIERHPDKYAHVCDGKKLATLFYEPSTRTRLSFEAAMLNLGGSVLGFSSADSSSAAKGESVADTIRVISCYADIDVYKRQVSSSSCLISSSQNTGRRSSYPMGFKVPGFKRGAGLFFISARTLYHWVGISLSSR